MALSADENHAKIASFIAPKGGKQSVRLYAVRLLGRGTPPATPFHAATQRGKTGSTRVAHRVPLCAIFKPQAE